MTTRLAGLVVGVLFTLAFGGPAAAQSRAAGLGVLAAVTATDVVRLLAESGIKGAVAGRDQVGDPLVTYKLGGRTVRVYFYDCANATCRGLQLSAGFAFEPRPTLVAVNRFNRAHRYGRVYLDEEGDPILESDLGLDGGVTGSSIKEWAGTFAMLLDDFLNEFKVR